MSDTPQGPGWWQASDGKWYPPQEPSPGPPTLSTSDQARQRIQWKADRRRKRREWWAGLGRSRQIVLVSILVTLALGLATVVAVVDTDSSSSDATAFNERNYRAFDVCKQFVQERLKAPSGATWRDPTGDQVVYEGAKNGPVTVRASVDSQNSFGAKLRSTYVCTVSSTGKDTWHLDDLQVNDGGDG